MPNACHLRSEHRGAVCILRARDVADAPHHTRHEVEPRRHRRPLPAHLPPMPSGSENDAKPSHGWLTTHDATDRSLQFELVKCAAKTLSEISGYADQQVGPHSVLGSQRCDGSRVGALQPTACHLHIHRIVGITIETLGRDRCSPYTLASNPTQRALAMHAAACSACHCCDMQSRCAELQKLLSSALCP